MFVLAEKCPGKTRKKSEKCKEDSYRKTTSVDPIVIEEAEEVDTGNNSDVLVCCKCSSIITTVNEKIEVNGAYNHSFANPHGMFFEIGCYKNAPGCAYSNESSGEFTWFTGFNWQIAVCRNCINHLGWLFSSSKSSFHGLISAQLKIQTIEE